MIVVGKKKHVPILNIHVAFCGVLLYQASASVYWTKWHAVVGRSGLPYTQLGRVTLHSGCQSDHQCVQPGRTSRDWHLHPVSHLQRLRM